MAFSSRPPLWDPLYRSLNVRLVTSSACGSPLLEQHAEVSAYVLASIGGVAEWFLSMADNHRNERAADWPVSLAWQAEGFAGLC